MPDANSAPLYHVWTSNNVSEGPFELPALVARVKSGQVGPKTWVYVEDQGTWGFAEAIPELGFIFKKTPRGADLGLATEVDVSLLRTIKVFAQMTDDLLAVFARYGEILSFPQFATVVKKGDHGDAMYSVLEGELRARSIVDERESTLTTLAPGDSFGEISLLDHGPRSADVVANEDSIVLKISAAALDKIIQEAPAAAAPFLHGLGRSAVGRIRALTKRYEDTIHLSRTAAMCEPVEET